MHEVEIFRPTLTRLVGVLNRVGVRFHLTGGVTAVAYGEPRMTQNLDLVIDSEVALRNREAFLCELAAAGFHVEKETARAAPAARTMFRILDIDQALKLKHGRREEPARPAGTDSRRDRSFVAPDFRSSLHRHAIG